MTNLEADVRRLAGPDRRGEVDAMTIVIIGAGFSGTLTAVHLLRGRGAAGRRVVLVNRSGAMARGVAYGTRSDQHVLNVPAGRMSAFEDDPDGFVRFVRRRGQPIDGGAFVCRAVYGEYLESLLRDAADRVPGGAFERLVAEVARIDLGTEEAAATVTLTNGVRLRADRVVLAVGNYPPQPPDVPASEGFWSSPRYIGDPWQPEAFAGIDPELPMLCVGTGLTMIDVVLERQRRGARGSVIAVSRHGLLPTPHRTPARPPAETAPPPELVDLALPSEPTVRASGPTVRGYCRAVRSHIRIAAARGVDWRDVIAALRPVTPALWQALSLDERRRWLRHLRPFWEIHRHRLAPELHDAFVRLQQAGTVRVLAARLIAIREDPHGIVVSLRHRGQREIHDLTVGSLVNCTGPAGDTHRLQDTLFATLQAQGLLRVDPLGLGIETSPDGAVLAHDGRPQQRLYYVGPFLRARDWEATAVPELRRHAHQLAEHLIEQHTNPLAEPRIASIET